MDPRDVRRTVDNLLADLLRNPRIGRPRSFMGRYGRPLGFGIALGMSGAIGCGGSGDGGDALPAAIDAYGTTDLRLPPEDTQPDGADVPTIADTREALPPARDTYGMAREVLEASVDTRDALPPAPDVYGITAVDGLPTRDTRDALPPGIDGSIDTRDALPPAPDAYGIMDRPLPVDTNDGGPLDGGKAD